METVGLEEESSYSRGRGKHGKKDDDILRQSRVQNKVKSIIYILNTHTHNLLVLKKLIVNIA